MADIIPPAVVHEMEIKGFETEVLQTPGSIHYLGNVFLPKGHRFYGKEHDEINLICILENGEDNLNYWLSDSYFMHEDYYWCIGFNTDNGDGTVPTLNDTINSLISLVELLV